MIGLEIPSGEHAYLEKVRRTIMERIAPEYPGWRKESTTPRRMFEIFGEEGLLGFIDGGGSIEQVPWVHQIHLYKELSQFSGGLAIATFVQGQLGNQSLFLYGNKEQRREHLAPGTRGKRIIAFANTEPTAGSDASAIKLQLKDAGDHFIANGTKAYITNGDIADNIVFTGVTHPNSEKRHKGISMFIVDGNAKGLHRTRMRKYGWRESHLSTLRFEDVRIPKEDMIGEIGRGFYQTMEIFNSGRIGVAALAFGAALGAYKQAYIHARKRSAFGKTLFEHESKRNEFADNIAKLQAGWLLIRKAAKVKDSGGDYKHYSSMAKLFNTEEGIQISLWAAVTFGARGVLKDNSIVEYPHDSLAAIIGEGAPEVQKKIISEHIDEILEGF